MIFNAVGHGNALWYSFYDLKALHPSKPEIPFSFPRMAEGPQGCSAFVLVNLKGSDVARLKLLFVPLSVLEGDLFLPTYSIKDDFGLPVLEGWILTVVSSDVANLMFRVEVVVLRMEFASVKSLMAVGAYHFKVVYRVRSS